MIVANVSRYTPVRSGLCLFMFLRFVVIYVTVEDMKKMAQFILKKGRSNITDITEECNKIVDLSSDAAEGFSKDREQVELLSPEDAGECSQN